MAKLPTVAIIGRPNTGKSTLFNRLVGGRKAIVSDIPGTTRDHIAHRIKTEDTEYLLLDTGGMGGGTADTDFEDDVEAQSLLALTHADLIVFTVNGKEELTKADHEIVSILRKKRKKHVPVILVVSKLDTPSAWDTELTRFYELGIGDETIAVSAAHNLGIDDLTSAIERHLTALHFSKQPHATEESAPRIAIVGKPNVGKSSLVNAFMSDMQKQKSPILVSDIAGTTRDSIDTEITYHGKKFVLTDTAGLKKTMRREVDIDKYATMRTVQAMQTADIIVIVLDASEPVSRQDKRIASMAVEAGKGIIFLLNKIDLLAGEERTRAAEELPLHFPFCRFAPLIPCSATTREGLLHLFDAIATVAENRARRVPTSKLNSWFQDVTTNRPVRTVGKANYITQTEINPPTFIVFVGNPKKVSLSDLRYLENRFRETFPAEGTPIRWVTRQK